MFQTIRNIYISSCVIITISWIHSVISASENLSRKTVTDKEFNTKTLITLNNYRKLHGVPPVEFDSQLAENAAKWAIKIQDKASRDGTIRPYYSHPHVEGENVMVHGNSPETIEGGDAIDHWYSEIKNYEFLKHLFSYNTAQFTQLVWKDTKLMGMAMVLDAAKNYTVFVARFSPPGNIGAVSSFKNNVLPLLKGAANKNRPTNIITTTTPKPHLTEGSVKPDTTEKSVQVAQPQIQIPEPNNTEKFRSLQSTLVKDLIEWNAPPPAPVIPHSVKKLNTVTDSPILEEVSKPKSTVKYTNSNQFITVKPNTIPIAKDVVPKPKIDHIVGRTAEEKPNQPVQKPKSSDTEIDTNSVPLLPVTKSAPKQKLRKQTSKLIENKPNLSQLTAPMKPQKPIKEDPKKKQKPSDPIDQTEIEEPTEDAIDDPSDDESELVTTNSEVSMSSTESESSEQESDISTTPDPYMFTTTDNATTTTTTTKSTTTTKPTTTTKKPKAFDLAKENLKPDNKHPNPTTVINDIKSQNRAMISVKRFVQEPAKPAPTKKPTKSSTNPISPPKVMAVSKLPNPKPKPIPVLSTKNKNASKVEVASQFSLIESDSDEVDPKGRILSKGTDPEDQDDGTTEEPETVEDEVTTVRDVKLNNTFYLPPDQIKFAEEGLKAHNKYRKLHGVPPLTLDHQLVFDSYEWAKENVATCDSKPKCILSNTKRQDRGENIYAVKGISNISGPQPVDYWYKENKFYNYSNPGYQWKAGHFTAVVWRNTKRMGMSWVKGKKGVIISVCQYFPPGNVAYSLFFKSNVLPRVLSKN